LRTYSDGRIVRRTRKQIGRTLSATATAKSFIKTVSNLPTNFPPVLTRITNCKSARATDATMANARRQADIRRAPLRHVLITLLRKVRLIAIANVLAKWLRQDDQSAGGVAEHAFTAPPSSKVGIAEDGPRKHGTRRAGYSSTWPTR